MYGLVEYVRHLYCEKPLQWQLFIAMLDSPRIRDQIADPNTHKKVDDNPATYPNVFENVEQCAPQHYSGVVKDL